MRVAFLGTGIMGAPMARNLARAGHKVVAWNRSPGKADLLRGDGVTSEKSASRAVHGADCTLLMLSTGQVCDEILFGSGAQPGVTETLSAGSVVMVMSSIPVATARGQAGRLLDRSIGYIDAPVSGGERGAVAGTLSIMAGGEAVVIERMRSVFDPLGRVTRVGPVGAGQLAKLANQLIVGVTIGAVAEALLLAESGGADPVSVRHALRGGFADSTILEQHGERMLTDNFAPGARAEVQLKDLETALAHATASALDLPFLALAESLFEGMCRHGRSQMDHSALYLELRERARLRRQSLGNSDQADDYP